VRSILRHCRRSHTAAAAYTSLFLALGGTAYAAATITGADIVDESIQSQDIAAQAIGTDELGAGAVTLDRLHGDSVTGTKVADGTLWGVDVRNGSLSGNDVADGSLYSSDVADDSLTGGDLNLDVKTVRAESHEPTSTDYWAREASVACPRDYTLLGGGAKIRLDGIDDKDRSDNEAFFNLVDSSPKIYVTSPYEQMGWTARAVHNPGFYTQVKEPEQFRLEVYARCAAL
jgi:hypothetical protein